MWNKPLFTSSVWFVHPFAGTIMGKKVQNNTALVRLRRDYMRLKSDPVPYISAEPLPSNILEW